MASFTYILNPSCQGEPVCYLPGQEESLKRREPMNLSEPSVFRRNSMAIRQETATRFQTPVVRNIARMTSKSCDVSGLNRHVATVRNVLAKSFKSRTPSLRGFLKAQLLVSLMATIIRCPEKRVESFKCFLEVIGVRMASVQPAVALNLQTRSCWEGRYQQPSS